MRALGALLLASLAFAAPAFADETPPWSVGVTDEAKTKAQGLLDEGNQLFVENRFLDALEKYTAAVELWNHPAIRFNIVRALIGLDRTVEAADNLELALKYGKEPMTDAIFQEAKAYQKLLAGQIANVSVSCTQAETKVSLDGQSFLSCPGTKRARLRPGKHMIVGERPGHLTLTKEVVALPAQDETIDVSLVDINKATVTQRRWATWKPWAVVGGGGALLLVGGLLQWRARADLDQYEATIAIECAMGCRPGEASASTLALEDRALLENRLAIATMVTGGIAVAAGVALVFLNRPREVLDEQLYRREMERTQITAITGNGQVGLGVRGSF